MAQGRQAGMHGGAQTSAVGEYSLALRVEASRGFGMGFGDLCCGLRYGVFQFFAPLPHTEFVRPCDMVIGFLSFNHRTQAISKDR